MVAAKEAATDFLAQKRIAVTGVSRTPGGHGANVVYRRLRERGYTVFAVNPNAAEVEGDPAYPTVSAIVGGVDGVVIAADRSRTEGTVRDCAAAGVTRVWMHRAAGDGSVCAGAATLARAGGMTVIEGGCPLMFDPTADLGHKLMKFVLSCTGSVPRHV